MLLFYFITDTAKSLPDAENALVTTETIRGRLAPDISTAIEEIHGAYDIGCVLYRISTSCPHAINTPPYFGYVVRRLFASTIIPILYAVPGIELRLCLDGCDNYLKEIYKAERLSDVEMQ
jgi:hypothetical protein